MEEKELSEKEEFLSLRPDFPKGEIERLEEIDGAIFWKCSHRNKHPLTPVTGTGFSHKCDGCCGELFPMP